MKLKTTGLVFSVGLAACSTPYNPLDDYEQLNPSTMLESPAAVANAQFTAEEIGRGQYLVGLLGCGSCHTNGALVGQPVAGQLLAGSDTGIAWSNPLASRDPGVVFPANLTPDVETGIGTWSVDDVVRMIQTGVDNHNGRTLPIMPWPAYANITPADARAIAAYLLSLPPVRHRVPDDVRPGQHTNADYIHFGVYRSKEPR
jgi:hypothetical protein